MSSVCWIHQQAVFVVLISIYVLTSFCRIFRRVLSDDDNFYLYKSCSLEVLFLQMKGTEWKLRFVVDMNFWWWGYNSPRGTALYPYWWGVCLTWDVLGPAFSPRGTHCCGLQHRCKDGDQRTCSVQNVGATATEWHTLLRSGSFCAAELCLQLHACGFLNPLQVTIV